MIDPAFINILLAALLTSKETADAPKGKEKAVFAGGCFWCMAPPFKTIPGVEEVVSGYTGGTTANPTYEDVTSETTGHVEAVEVSYDPAVVSYRQLLDVFWRQIDPTDDGGQFADRGPSYRTAIFYRSDEQRELAEESKEDLEKSGRFGKPVATMIRPAGPFYRAEEYHQDYAKKNPVRYRIYRSRSGREQYLEEAWDAKPEEHEAEEQAQPRKAERS